MGEVAKAFAVTLSAITQPVDRLVSPRSAYRLTRFPDEPVAGQPTSLGYGYDWEHESYFRAEPRRDSDELLSCRQRAAAGVELGLVGRVALDLAGGYAFDRFHFEGCDDGDRHQGRVDVGDGTFGSLRVQARL